MVRHLFQIGLDVRILLRSLLSDSSRPHSWLPAQPPIVTAFLSSPSPSFLLSLFPPQIVHLHLPSSCSFQLYSPKKPWVNCGSNNNLFKKGCFLKPNVANAGAVALQRSLFIVPGLENYTPYLYLLSSSAKASFNSSILPLHNNPIAYLREIVG